MKITMHLLIFILLTCFMLAVAGFPCQVHAETLSVLVTSRPVYVEIMASDASP